LVGVKATVRLADDAVLWQPPIEWQVDPRVVEMDQAALGELLVGEPFEPERSDILVLQRPERAEGAIDAVVIARVGELEQQLTVLFPASPDPPPTPVEPPPPGLSCGSCAAAGPGAPLWAAVPALLLRRRRTRSAESARR
jgi:hypothetical protein